VKATPDRTIDLLKRTGALLEGHFRLSSGRHSDRYCQCAKLLEHPAYAEEVGESLAGLFRNQGIDVVVAPALGGIIIGHEVARALGARSIFAERQDGTMTLRRGFALESGSRVLVVEDVVTTGGSVREVADLARRDGAVVVGFGFILDRSGVTLDLGAPARALARMPLESYEPEECPLCERGLAITKPGSRPDARP